MRFVWSSFEIEEANGKLFEYAFVTADASCFDCVLVPMIRFCLCLEFVFSLPCALIGS